MFKIEQWVKKHHFIIIIIFKNSTLSYSWSGNCPKENLIMYLINFGLLKNLELINDHLEIEILERNFDLGATQQYLLIMFCIARWSNKYMFPMFCFKFNKKLDSNHQVLKVEN